MGNSLDYIKDKMDLKSHRDRMDERFNNGVQVAAALAPMGTKVGQKAYYMHKNAKRNVIRKRLNKNGKLSADDEKELVRLNDLAEKIEEDYGW